MEDTPWVDVDEEDSEEQFEDEIQNSVVGTSEMRGLVTRQIRLVD
jgi:hypothetical protein